MLEQVLSMAAGTNPTAKQLYEFGPFQVDPEKELLLREGETVPLTQLPRFSEQDTLFSMT